MGEMNFYKISHDIRLFLRHCHIAVDTRLALWRKVRGWRVQRYIGCIVKTYLTSLYITRRRNTWMCVSLDCWSVTWGNFERHDKHDIYYIVYMWGVCAHTGNESRDDIQWKCAWCVFSDACREGGCVRLYRMYKKNRRKALLYYSVKLRESLKRETSTHNDM